MVGAAAGLGLGYCFAKERRGMPCKSGSRGRRGRRRGGLLAQNYTFRSIRGKTNWRRTALGSGMPWAAGTTRTRSGNSMKSSSPWKRKSQQGGGAVLKMSFRCDEHAPSSEERVKQMNELAAKSPERKAVTNTRDSPGPGSSRRDCERNSGGKAFPAMRGFLFFHPPRELPPGAEIRR